MADDEFDIDIYGDTNTEQDGDFKKDEEGDMKIGGIDPVNRPEPETNGVKHEEEVDDEGDGDKAPQPASGLSWKAEAGPAITGEGEEGYQRRA